MQAGGRARFGAQAPSHLGSPHRLCAADRRLLALTASLRTAEAGLPLRPVALAQAHRGEVVPVAPHGPLGIARLPGMRLGDAWRLLRRERLGARYAAGLDLAEPERAMAIDDRSLEEHGRLYYGARAVERWLEPAWADSGCDDDGHTSRVAFLLREESEREAVVGTLRVSLDVVAAHLAASFEAQLGVRVERIEGGRGRLRVATRDASGSQELEADAVVLAVPAPEAARIARELLFPFEAALLDGRSYGASVSAWMELERTPVAVATRVRVPRAESAALAALHLEPPARSDTESGLAHVVARDGFSRARLDVPDDTVAKELATELERLVPGCAPRIPSARIRRHTRAWPRFSVGAYRDLARLRRIEAIERRAGRRLYLAGDYLAAPWLEAAVASGERAAAALLQDLGGADA